MKNLKALALALIVLAVLSLALVSCGDENEHTHTFSDATCTAPKTCECGATEGEALGHTPVTDAAKAPTCTESGLTEGSHCSVCDTVITEQTEVAALGHDYSAVVTAPTCTADGYTTYTCACGDTNVVTDAPALGHDYSTVVTAPTCTEGGYTTYTCACGDSYVGDNVDALGHDYSTVVTAATCTTDGYTTYTCACGDSYVGDVVKAHHTYDADGKCSVCEGVIVTVVPEVDKGYIFGMYQGKMNDVYFLKGGMDGYYMATTTNPAEAILVYLEQTEGGYYAYTIDNGAKLYINMVVSGTHVNGAYEATASTVYTIDAEHHTLIGVVNGGDYWFATRNDKTYTTMGPCLVSYNGFYGEFYDAHHHSFEKGETTAPTCTEAGYTTYSCSCGASEQRDPVDALGHSFTDGKCSVCEEADPDYVAPSIPSGGAADFDTIVTSNANGSSSYTGTYTTTAGWIITNSAIQAGGASVANPQFPVIGPDNTHKAPCLNGKVGAAGTITSPTLEGGISKLTINYTKMFTDTKLSVTVTVTDVATGTKYTHDITVELPKDEKYVVYTDVWTLETPIGGQFTIEIVNNCPNAATGNKDRMTILDLTWEGGHTHDYTVTTTATCTAAGTTTYTCECGDTYTEETEKLGHVDENLDISCDRQDCTGKVAPAADSTLSVFTANNLGSKLSTSVSYYVEGTIVEVLDARNGVFLLSDGVSEGTFYFRLPKNADGVLHANWEVKLVLGDKVRVYGKVNKYSSTSAPNGSYYPAIQSGLVTILEQHPHDFTAVPATCTDPAFCFCGQSSGDPLGHTDSNVDNACDVCGWRMDAKVESVDTHYNDIKDTEYLTTDTATFKGVEFDVVVEKGGSTINNNGADYQRVQNLNNLVIKANNGKRIISVTFTTTTESYVDELQLFLTSAGYTEQVTDGVTVTISVDSLEVLTLANSSKKVARIVNVEIGYVDAPAAE